MSNGVATPNDPFPSTTSTSKEPRFLNVCGMHRDEMIRLSVGSSDDRKNASLPLSKVTVSDVLKQEEMTLFEHVATVLFLMLGVPNGALTIPLITFLFGKFVVGNIYASFRFLGIVLLTLAMLPQPFVSSRLHSWMAIRVVKYFSFRIMFEEDPQQLHSPHSGLASGNGCNHSTTNKEHHTCATKNGHTKVRPQILVAPPHGVFPYGNLLALIAWPLYAGYHFQGLAANAAVKVPVFKQILRSIGVIDASRSSAQKALENYPYTIGISTGGVAEVFETNAKEECILLYERVGLIKLAIRTGADLIPCYLFGNTKLLSCWNGDGIHMGRTVLEKISRRVGFALVLPFGRFGLPIPHRVPVFAATGVAIPTFHIKCDDPSKEQIEQIQGQLIDAVQALFDNHKHLYNWEEKRLVIK